jgi:hypothetical protein
MKNYDLKNLAAILSAVADGAEWECFWECGAQDDSIRESGYGPPLGRDIEYCIANRIAIRLKDFDLRDLTEGGTRRMSALKDAARRVIEERFKPGGEWADLCNAIAELSDALDRFHSGEPADNGGPAFSVPNDAYNNDMQDMTPRDWLAGMALQGYLAGRNNMSAENPMNFERHRAAKDCYNYADAMLTARKEGA